MAERQDHWSSEAYKTSASFVPLLTTRVTTLLSPRPTDQILDIGCGDAVLTSTLASLLDDTTGKIHGLDASPSMISSARDLCSSRSQSNASFSVADCSRLSASAPEMLKAQWDAVFSNAALHWILRDPDTRQDVFGDLGRALRPGGRLVFEMGGKGNVAEVHAAVVAALVAHGVEMEAARESVPWFFPSEQWMRRALEGAGLEVQVLESEYRPTKLTAEGGLKGWVRLMCASCLEAVEEGKREAVVQMVDELLRGVVTMEEDGSQWIGYVRLRAVARKPQ